MPPRRVRPPTRAITFALEGKRLAGDAHASLATALLAAGHLGLARSPKFRRPRGPACLRGGCEGCLMRVDGVPNVMTCLVKAEDGMQLERQNITLSAKVDLLRANDWFFPEGMNHHELLAGVPGLSKVMLSFARRVSGLGELPAEPANVLPIVLIQTDVLVVGGGPAGLSASRSLLAAGFRVHLVDDQHSIGGSLNALAPGATLHDGDLSLDVDEWRADLLEVIGHKNLAVRQSSTVLGVLEGDDWLVSTGDGLERISAAVVLLATGGHDTPPTCDGNDIPGVISARAAGKLLREGVLIGERPCVVGQGPFAQAFVAAATQYGAICSQFPLESLDEIRGLSRVKSAVIQGEPVVCDSVVVDQPCAPSFELAVQAAASVVHQPSGYFVRQGRIERSGRSVFAVGEMTGQRFAPFALAKAAAQVAEEILQTFRAQLP